MEDKLKYLTKIRKSFYDVMSDKQKRERLEYLKKSEPKGDVINHKAKIKALEELLGIKN